MKNKLFKSFSVIMIVLLLLSSVAGIAGYAEDTNTEQSQDSSTYSFEIGDAMLVQRYCAGFCDLSENQKKLYDVSFDGVVSVIDVTVIQMHLAGILNINSSEYQSLRPDGTVLSESGYPLYWQSEINDTVQKIRSLQCRYGDDLICFAWSSDMHIHPIGRTVEKYLGAVTNEVMDQCEIPYFIISGDIFSNSHAWKKSQTKKAYSKAFEYLQPVSEEKLLIIRGNHDAWYGTSGNQYFVDGLSPDEIYNYLFLPQTKDPRRVFSEDGSYFYLDDTSHKTRIICLNSQWADFTRDPTTNLPLYNTQKHAGFGQEQFDWLIESLAVPEGYSVIVTMHTPISDKLSDGRRYVTGEGARDLGIMRGILTAYCNKTTYSGKYTHNKTMLYGYEGEWADVSVSCDFSEYNGTLRGIFCGHSHYDQLTTSDIPAPLICITCACDSPYDADASTRVLGTTDETAIDFVCLNTKTGNIDLIRCGYGEDRKISWNN